ncbi:MAG: PaREP1 family protein [Caldivirga sp.]
MSNFNKIIERKRREGREDEVKWYLRIGYTAPTTGLVSVSRDLEDLGYRGIVNLTTAMLGVHRYAYNGLDRDVSPFGSRREAIISLKELMKSELEIIESLNLDQRGGSLLRRLGGNLMNLVNGK